MPNLIRFLKKCLFDRPAAIHTAQSVFRLIYGKMYWFLRPQSPLAYRLPTGHILWLEPGHSFTRCFWPSVDKYEPDVRELLKYVLKPGYSFVDCGANIGYFSVLAAGLVGYEGQVIAIEANPVTYRLLERNLQDNDFGLAVHAALTTEPGEVELFVPEKGGDVYSSLRQGGLVSGKEIRSYKVPGHTLDDVVQKIAPTSVEVIKIDVEGAELDVLRSGLHLLSNFRPIVIMEYSTNTWPAFGATPAALKDIVFAYNYALYLFDLQARELVTLTEEVWESPYVNIVLMPAEQIRLSI